jgi:hypothetical protein
MPTPAQQAFSEGFTALLDVHGQTWTFGAATFAGVSSPLSPSDPRMVGSADYLLELEVLASSLTQRPSQGDELIQDGFYYRVSHIHHVPARGVIVFLLTVAGAVAK